MRGLPGIPAAVATISGSDDDAEENLNDGGVNLTSSDLEMTMENNPQLVGMRFVLDVPANATIRNAYIQFTVDETTEEATALEIHAEAADDAAGFVDSATNLTSRVTTSSSVDWAPPPWTSGGSSGTDQQSQNLEVLVQEIVNRPGWARGNHFVVLVSGNGKRVAVSYDGDPWGAPSLHVEYNDECGDGDCQPYEDCFSCEGDCGACAPGCNDGECGQGETCENCLADCGHCPECGDGTCEDTESCTLCTEDCGECPDVVPFSFFIASDVKSGTSVFEDNIQSMVAFDSDAIALFVIGDITEDGAAGQYVDHLDALVNAAPDDRIPEWDGSGIRRGSFVRTDATDWGPYIRYFGAVGNHETHVSDWYDNYNTYLSGQAGLGENSPDGIYFSFTYENAFFIVLDSENTSDAQSSWLEAQLTSSEATAADWRLAFFHHPVYPCCPAKGPFDNGLEWVESFERHGFDVAFVAHSHTYERTCPMIGGSCSGTDDGVIYLNTSGGGAGTRVVDTSMAETVSSGGRTDDYRCSDILVAHRGEWHHFCHFAVAGCEMTMTCYSDDYYASVEAPYDTMVLSHCE